MDKFPPFSLLSQMLHFSSFLSCMFWCYMSTVCVYEKINSESVNFFVCFFILMLRCRFIFSLISRQHIGVPFNDIVSWELIFLFSFLHMFSTPFATFYKHKDRILKFPEKRKEVCREILVRLVSFVSPIFLNFILFFILLFYISVLFVDRMYVVEN